MSLRCECRSDASESLARIDDSDLSGFTILEESATGSSGAGHNGTSDGNGASFPVVHTHGTSDDNDDDEEEKDRLSDADAHDRFKALLNDVDDLLKAKVGSWTRCAYVCRIQIQNVIATLSFTSCSASPCASSYFSPS